MRRRTALATLALCIAASGCNSHPLTAIPVETITEQRDEQRQVENFSTPVDILFIVDNSGSMEEEQNNLAANFGLFIEAIQATPADFRIAVISTDTIDPNQSGRFLAKEGNPKILVRTTPELSRVFRENARLGTMGDGFEKGLQAMETALSAPLINGHNAGFLRSNAVLGIVLLSDEEDCSHPDGAIPEFDGDECVRNPDKMYPVKRYIDFLKNLKGGDAGKIFFAAITGPDLLTSTARPTCATNNECTSGRCSDGSCCPGTPMLTECRSNDDCAAIAGTACYGRRCLPADPIRACTVEGTCAAGRPRYAPRTCSCYNAGTGLTEPGTRYIDVMRAFGQNGIYAPICASDWAKSLRDIAGLAVDIICKFPLSTLKANPNRLSDDARDIIVKVNRQEVSGAGWNYNCPEPQSADFKNGSVSFDATSCPALNSTMQFIYVPAETDDPPATCGPPHPVAQCPAGQRCGNCGYCERQ